MLSRFRTRRPVAEGGDAASSDAIYASGGWDKLRDLRELARYAIIGGYCAHLGARTVLDVGCGEGLLAERLPRPPIEDYVGMDFSAVAIGQAQAKGIGRARFLTDDAMTFTPDRRFDVVIFNEMLCYLKHPEHAVARLATWLEPHGRVIVSMFRNDHDWVWRAIEPVCERLDAVTVGHGSGLTWDLQLLRPRDASRAGRLATYDA